MSRGLLVSALSAAAFLSSFPHPAWAQKLAERHKNWIETDVIYIISKEERDLFTRLTNDVDRDKYVEQFWARRDPTPGTPENEFRDEHSKRIRFANTYFGSEWNSDGWRTDRGKIYIILGPPASRQFHTSGGQIYPIELWFYSNPQEPALPPFFNIMFYQKDGMSDYRLYSPYLDGPTRLVRASGIENRSDRAYRFLREYNAELARASLSLIPSEPVDPSSGPSLSSDSMLTKIVNIANDKFHKERIGLSSKLREDVSVRLIPDRSNLRAVAVPIVDLNGESHVHYALQTSDASTFMLGRHKDKFYVTLEAHVRILDAKTKAVVLETTREASAYFDEKEAEEFAVKPISFEDRLPLPPGSYQIEFGLLNRLTRVFSRATASVEMGASKAGEVSVGKPVLVWNCEPSRNLREPFVFGGSRCAVSALNEILPSSTASVNLLYPVSLPTGLEKTASPLRVQYTVGRLDRAVPPRVIEDQLDPRRFDSRGRLYVGKSISLKDLPEGNYLISIRVTETPFRKNYGANLSFRIGPGGLVSGTTFRVVEPGTGSKEATSN